MSYTPDWIFDISIVRTASEFLSLTQPMDSLAKKYSTGLNEHYSVVEPELMAMSAQELLIFLSLPFKTIFILFKSISIMVESFDLII